MIVSSCLVALSAMAGYALDAAFVGEFGFTNAAVGFAVAAAVTLPLTVVIAFAIARNHIDIDLLTRACGYGYLGSTITSLVYATYTVIFLAYEGAIMAQAVTAVAHIPLAWTYLIVSLVMIPLTLYGMSFTAKFQARTWPVWIILIGIAIVGAATSPHAATHMTDPFGVHGGDFGGVSLVAVTTIAAANLSLATQVGEQGDYLRLMRDPRPATMRSWRAAVAFSGPGMSLFAIVIFLASSLLVGFAASAGVPAAELLNPVSLFTAVYQRVFGNHAVALAFSATLIILSQLKINIMNTYSGSLSWSNFFSRLLHRHPGRATWVFFQVALALALMEWGVFSHIVTILGWYANIGIAWIGTLVADLVINKKWLKLSPPVIEFHRAHLYNLNPVGFGSLVIASTVSMIAYFDAFGHTAKELSPFIALAIALVLPPVLAWLTNGRWYLARTSVLPDDPQLTCVACGDQFDRHDMAACPHHKGIVCSLCCSTESKCHDGCKDHPWHPTSLAAPVWLPAPRLRQPEPADR
ncbi:purine-cytosine permease family protein [Jongsikchunia kroppenstedtii]|uniref:purine-cytosine permease family protein n=1 Tax=Jongsikchunia kroppenstedtii TaxID=1121721 RepID=UPI001C9DB04E|nr:histidine kinase [Jongsikchunia kroppenstedtii]